MYFALVTSENVISSESQIAEIRSSSVNYSIDPGQDRGESNQCTITPNPRGESNVSSLSTDELKALESLKSLAKKETKVNIVDENDIGQESGRRKIEKISTPVHVKDLTDLTSSIVLPAILAPACGGGRHHGSGGSNWEATVERNNTLPKGGADMTLSELQEMATRQQQQIESQQHILVAKEQHLKYLKQQEQKQQQLASESEQLRKLRDRVETQELKLKKLRALRGQVEQQKASNGNLNYELESIKAFFNEKEKELSEAVVKVEEMNRQLDEIRSGRIKSSPNTHSPAALAELEKLKKELMIRNKLNEQQNMKMASTRELLVRRKDELVRMDHRIRELQERLKKKKSMGAEMLEKNRNQLNKPISDNNILNCPSTNVASFEPYVQEINTNNVSSGFAKKNPIYHSLPNSKISYPDKVNLSGETNNNNVTYPAKQYNDSRSDEYSIPLVVAVDSANRLSHNKLPPSPKQSPVNPPQGSLPYPMPSTLQIPQPQSSFNVNHSRFGTSVPVKAGISHFAPKPYCSTYSSAMFPNRGTGGVQNDLVHLNSPDDVRQAGSGQSSPRSIDSLNGSPKFNLQVNPSTVKGQQISRGPEMETQPIDRQSLEVQSKMPPPIPNRTTFPSDINQSNVSIPVSSISTTMANGSNSQENNSNIEQTNLTVSKVIPKFSVFGNQQHKEEKKIAGVSLNSGGFSNLNHASALGAVRPAPTYRYASKSVIANTYFGKLGGENLEKYQKSVLSLHRDLNTSSKPELTIKSELSNTFEANKHVEKICEDEKESYSHVANQNLPVNSSPSPASPSGLSNDPFDFPSIPPHADVASDKVSYKPNTPKNIRRRHSDSDNEEVTKAIHKYGINANVNKNPLVQENELLALVNNPGAVEIQATAFNINNHIPETVLLDNKGNFVEVLDNNIEDLHNIEDFKNTDVADNVKLPTVTIEVKSSEPIVKKKTNLKTGSSRQSNNRVTFDPLALLLDASLEGELDLVRRCAHQVENVSASNDEGITALHNAICAGHYDIVTFLVEYGCDVNSPDSDGWTPLHCAASCNNLPMVKFLVEHGACIFATTISDHETAAEKCEEEEDGYEGCTEYLYSIQEKLGIMNNGTVYAVFDYSKQNSDELDLGIGDSLTVLRKGDDKEKEWWWAKKDNQEGYIPRNLLGLTPRVLSKAQPEGEV